MINGEFIYGCPSIELKINKAKIKLLLDTGFNGQIMLPQSLIDEFGLAQIGFSDFTLASGEQKRTNIYKVEIDFFDKIIKTDVLSTNADFSLVGMELFHKCRIVIERCNDLVQINKIST